MAELLLINPAKRRRVKRAAKSTARRTARRVVRRRNPIKTATPAARRVMRRAVSRRRINPIRARRRSNPINMGGLGKAIMTMAKEAALGAAGSLAIDMAMGQVSRVLPASLQRTPGRVGAGDAVKAVLTVIAGRALAKATKGASVKMAQGALTVQAAEMLRGFVPAGMAMGYFNPSPMIQASGRVGPIRGPLQNGQVGAYTRPGVTPLLNAYTRPGVTPLLSGSASKREGVRYR